MSAEKWVLLDGDDGNLTKFELLFSLTVFTADNFAPNSRFKLSRNDGWYGKSGMFNSTAELSSNAGNTGVTWDAMMFSVFLLGKSTVFNGSSANGGLELNGFSNDSKCLISLFLFCAISRVFCLSKAFNVSI